MRASRLVELLVLLQLRGGASATELAEALEVSVRTIYRDVEALGAAGVPLYAEVGRNGGIRIDPAYRIAGLPRLQAAEARSILFAIVPAIAEQLGFDTAAAERTLLPAMERSSESAARIVRERLLVEPTHWFLPPDDTPRLAEVATAVWETRELQLTYRGRDLLAQPLGLILKDRYWYLLARARPSGGRPLRLFRVSRIEYAEALPQRFEPPRDFDLAAAWAELREAFLAQLPEYFVSVRVAPAAEPLLALLDEGRPELPLPADTARDATGWALLDLRFEQPETAARHLLRLGPEVEVLAPADLRARMTAAATGLAALYADR